MDFIPSFLSWWLRSGRQSILKLVMKLVSIYLLSTVKTVWSKCFPVEGELAVSA